MVPAAGSPYHQFNYTLNDNGKLEKHGSKPNDYLTDVLNLKVRSFIKAPSAQPFFAYVGVYNPHAPATPAPRHANLFKGVKAPRTPRTTRRTSPGNPPRCAGCRPCRRTGGDLGRALPRPAAVAAVRRRHDR